MKYVIALTGATGNMGLETLRQLMEIEEIEIGVYVADIIIVRKRNAGRVGNLHTLFLYSHCIARRTDGIE